MASAFGVTQSAIEAELVGVDGVDDFSAEVEEWITRYAHSIERRLRAQGFDASEVQALGGDDSLYSLCAEYIVHCVCSRLLSSGAMQDTDKAQLHREEATRLLDELRDVPEATTSAHNVNEQMGTARTNRRFIAGADRNYEPITIFRRGMKF